jgi:alkyl hydroperoxide reductase subunit AhpC
MEEQGSRLPLIGEKAPSFVAEATQGTIHFPEDYKCLDWFLCLKKDPGK